MSTTNNEQYKINQRQGWNGVADEWLKCWDVIEPASKNISLRMIELANIKEGSKILDVATGIGEPSIHNRCLSSRQKWSCISHRYLIENAINIKTKKHNIRS